MGTVLKATMTAFLVVLTVLVGVIQTKHFLLRQKTKRGKNMTIRDTKQQKGMDIDQGTIAQQQQKDMLTQDTKQQKGMYIDQDTKQQKGMDIDQDTKQQKGMDIGQGTMAQQKKNIKEGYKPSS